MGVRCELGSAYFPSAARARVTLLLLLQWWLHAACMRIIA